MMICDCVIFSKSLRRSTQISIFELLRNRRKKRDLNCPRSMNTVQTAPIDALMTPRTEMQLNLGYDSICLTQCDSKQTSHWTAKVRHAFDLALLIEFLFWHDTHSRHPANRHWSDTINICFNFISHDCRNCTQTWHSWHPHNCFLSIDFAIRLSMESLMSIPTTSISSHWREVNRRKSRKKNTSDFM